MDPNICICQVNNNDIHVYENIYKLLNKHDKLDLIVLPECFNAPYGSKFFEKYAEEKNSDKSVTYAFLKYLAIKN